MMPNHSNYLKDFRFWFLLASFLILAALILQAYPMA